MMTTALKTRVLTNSFHNTECRTRLTEDGIRRLEEVLWNGQGEELKRAKRTQRRIWTALCGIEGCTCGDFLGRR